ncbi:MAG: alanine racemase, partial [Polyangiales bacterium]
MHPDSPTPQRPRIQSADASLRATRAEILLDAIGHNLRVVRAASNGRKILAVVKADAYGHGVVPVAQRLQADGVDGFGVALAEEGLELREAGIDRAILVLNGIHGGAHRDIIAAGLTPVVYELSEASAFEAVADSRPIDVHLKVETGMGRLGVPLVDLDAFLRELRRFP